MKLRLAFALIVAIGSAAAFGGFACGGGGETHGGLGGGGSNSSGTHHPASTGSDSGGGSFAGPSSGPGGNCKTHCSSDLHSVVDCNGNVVKTCPMDQGCAPTRLRRALVQSAKENKSSVGLRVLHASSPTSSAAAPARASPRTSPTPGTRRSPSTSSCGGHGARPSPSCTSPSGSGQNITYTPLAGGHDPGRRGRDPLPLARAGRRHRLDRVPARASRPPSPRPTPAMHGTGIGNAFHITTTAPVVAYDIFPYGGGPSAMTSATLLLPTSAWDTNYIAVDAFGRTSGTATRRWTSSRRRTARTITIIADGRHHGRHRRRRRGRRARRHVHRQQGADPPVHADRRARGSVIQSDKPDRRLGRRDVRSTCHRGVLRRLGAPANPARARARRASTRACATATVTPARSRVAAVAPRRRGRRHDAHLGAGAARGRAVDARARAGRAVRRRRALRRAEPGRRAPVLRVGAHDGRRPQYDPRTRPYTDGRGDPSSSTSSRPPSTSRATCSSPTRPTRRRTSSSCAKKGGGRRSRT